MACSGPATQDRPKPGTMMAEFVRAADGCHDGEIDVRVQRVMERVTTGPWFRRKILPASSFPRGLEPSRSFGGWGPRYRRAKVPVARH